MGGFLVEVDVTPLKKECMVKIRLVGLLIVIFCCVCGCAKAPMSAGRALMAPKPAAPLSEAADKSAASPERMLIWRAWLTLEVRDVAAGIDNAAEVAAQFGGYVESKSEESESSGSMSMRIPADRFRSAVGALEGLGEVVRKSVSGQDVTEQYVDIEARLKTKKELRDRLQQLLSKAKDVKDVIAIETELNRIQADIDSMEARMRVLKGQVDYATVDVSFKKKKVLGPLGYLFKGVWWGVEKLFVISD